MGRDRPPLTTTAPGRAGSAVAFAAVAATVAALVAWPTAVVLARGWPRLGDVVTSARTWRIVGFTVAQAVASTFLTMVIALPAAWSAARWKVPGRNVVAALTVALFCMPTVVVATAISSMVPRSVPGLGPLLWAHVAFNVAVVVQLVRPRLAELDPSFEDVARTLGATPAQAARHVVLPLVAPAIAAAAGVVALLCATSFGAVLLLGDPARPTTEVEVWRLTIAVFDLPGAAALAAVQLAVVTVLVAVASATGPSSSSSEPRARTGERPRRAIDLATAVVPLVGVVVVCGLPLVALVRRSLDGAGGPTLSAYRGLATERPGSGLSGSALDALATSVRLAAPATALALLLALLATLATRGGRRRARVVETVVSLPVVVSAITLGLGMLLAFNRAPLDLRGRTSTIVIVQAIVALPFVARPLVAAASAIPAGLHDAAATLGASPWRVAWRVDLPLLARPLAAATALGVAITIGEFGATSLLARPGNPTAPIAIARLLARPGAQNQSAAAALCVMLGGLTAAVVLLADRVRR